MPATTSFRRAVLARLAILQHAPEEAAIVEWERALTDVPDDVLDAAVSHAIRTRVFFPTPAELRADCDAVVDRFRLTPPPAPPPLDAPSEPQAWTFPLNGTEVTLTVRRGWRDDCDACHDTGWAEFWCGPIGAEPIPGQPPFLPVRPCPRSVGSATEHPPHAYAVACPCADTNPTILRRKAARLRRFAEPPEKVQR